MRLAWFRTTPPDSGALLDRTAALIDALRRTHTVDVVTATEAHDFVWKHGRHPYDLCVYEVGSSRDQRFMKPYLLHYPGVVCVGDTSLLDSRMSNGSRMVVVSDAGAARALASEWPAARIRHVPPGLGEFQGPSSGFQVQHRASQLGVGSWGLGVGTIDPSRRAVVERAVQRARNLGAALHLCDTPGEAGVIAALEWPPRSGPPVPALHAMASGRVAIVLEVEVTAGWPLLDPQTWLPRGFGTEPPIAISLDPRDEEHSLMLALVRLAADPSLVWALGAAARTWWQAHATIDHAVGGWEAILLEAMTLGPASRQDIADGSERARAILAEIGTEVDFLIRDS
jgi:hypothetical protein